MANLFLVTEPLRGWRQVTVSQQRTRIDFASCIKDLVDIHSPDAERSVLVLLLDQLNTHSPASLYAAFSPDEARRLTETLAWHHTPKHGRWLNMAELELSVLAGQRLPDREAMAQAVAAWADRRNATVSTIDWPFGTADARIKLRRLYPTFDA